MASSISRDGFDAFMQKALSLNLKSTRDAVAVVAEAGRAYAQAQYTGEADITVMTEAKGNRASVVAKGAQVLYEEFGTGKVGKGTYAGNLPTQTFTFESPAGSGEIQHTQGWEYFYPNPRTKRGDAWYHKGQRYIGERASGQMWKTRTYLRANASSTFAEVLKRKQR